MKKRRRRYDREFKISVVSWHFIEQMYNKKRLHSALGYRSPDQFEMEVTLNRLLNYLSTIRGAVHS